MKRKSKFKGVYENKDAWQSKIRYNKKDINLGRFVSQEEAAKNYDYHALKLYGKDVYLNFPDFDYTSFVPKKENPLERKIPKKSSVKREGWGRKLNFEIAREIRIRHINEKLSIKYLAKEYGVTFSAISRLLHNITYPERSTAQVFVTYNPKNISFNS